MIQLAEGCVVQCRLKGRTRGALVTGFATGLGLGGGLAFAGLGFLYRQGIDGVKKAAAAPVPER